MNYPLALTIVGVAFCVAQVLKAFLRFAEHDREEREAERRK